MKNKTRNVSQFSTFLGLVVASLFLTSTALASVPVSITQQGRILDSDGEPLTGNHTLEFALYDSPTGGVILWSDSVTTTLNEHGVYSVTLGNSAQPIDAELLRDGDVYLGMTAGENEMSPRLELTAVPFAAMSEVALSVADGSVTSSAFAPGAVTSDAIDSVAWDQITGVPSEVTDSTDTLAELSCEGSQVAIHDGTAWSCGDLPEPVTYDGNDFAVSNQSCTGSQVAVGVSDSGQLICDDQQDTTYSAGDGLNLSGTDQFSINLPYLNDRFVRLPTHGNYLEIEQHIRTNGNLHLNSNSSDDWASLYFEGRLSGTSSAVIAYVPDDNRLAIFKQDLVTVGSNFYNSDMRLFGSYLTGSDRKLKRDITYIDGVLDEVLLLQPASYRYKNGGNGGNPTYGFIAQDVQEHFPNIVSSKDADGFLSLSYDDFGVLAIQAIKEQQEIIDAQADEIEMLRNQLGSVEDRLSSLEAGR